MVTGDAVRVMVGLDTLERRDIGPIWGGVWCEIDGQEPFPEERWDDIVVAVVVVLFDAAQTAARPGDFSPIDVYFFDGPLELRLSPAPGDQLTMRFRHRDRQARTDMTNGRRAFLESVKRAADRLLAECDRLGWSDDNDVEELRRHCRAPID